MDGIRSSIWVAYGIAWIVCATFWVMCLQRMLRSPSPDVHTIVDIRRTQRIYEPLPRELHWKLQCSEMVTEIITRIATEMVTRMATSFTISSSYSAHDRRVKRQLSCASSSHFLIWQSQSAHRTLANYSLGRSQLRILGNHPNAHRNCNSKWWNFRDLKREKQ